MLVFCVLDTRHRKTVGDGPWEGDRFRMNMDINSRRSEAQDVEAISSLAILTYTSSFGHSFSAQALDWDLERQLCPQAFRHMLSEDGMLLADSPHGLRGLVQFGRFKPAEDVEVDGGIEIRRLYVHPDSQRKGIGSSLMTAALAAPEVVEARRLYLDVSEHNQGAVRFYRRFGFEIVGTRRFEIRSGAETSADFVMVRENSWRR